MLDLDFAARIRALRSTYSDIAQVTDLPRLDAEIADLEQQASAPGLWMIPNLRRR